MHLLNSNKAISINAETHYSEAKVLRMLEKEQEYQHMYNVKYYHTH